MRPAVILSIVVLLAGCATSGTKADPDAVASFQRGQTTYDEVVAQIGQPTALSVTAIGSRVAVWSYTRVTTHAVSYVPVAGLFAGGADASTQSITLRFSPDGTLFDSTSAQGQAGAHVGF